MPPYVAIKSLRLRRLALLLPRWLLAPAVIALVALLWSIGALWLAVVLAGACLVGIAALLWWRWATREHPPARPTLFVVRHRQQRAVRVLRAIERDLAQDEAVIESLARRLEGGATPDEPGDHR